MDNNLLNPDNHRLSIDEISSELSIDDKRSPTPIKKIYENIYTIPGNKSPSPKNINSKKILEKYSKLPKLKPFETPRSLQEKKFSNMEQNELQIRIVSLQNDLCKSYNKINDLNMEISNFQNNENKKNMLKKRFGTIEARYTNCDNINNVIKDTSLQIISVLTEIYKGVGGIIILDIPQNSNLGATNNHEINYIKLFSNWTNNIEQDMIDSIEILSNYDDIVIQKKYKIYGSEDIKNMDMDIDIDNMTVLSIISDSTTVALAFIINSNIVNEDLEILHLCLTEIWSTNVKSLIDTVIEKNRKIETNNRLTLESNERNMTILDLEIIIDEIVEKNALSRSNQTYMWEQILSGVANYFDTKYQAEIFIAVTNAKSNLRARTKSGSHTSSNTDGNEITKTLYYIFSTSAQHVKNTKMKNLNAPEIKKSTIMKSLIKSKNPYYTNDTSHFNLPKDHMIMKNALLVPIIFQDEVVAILGMSNGIFDETTGRILSSVFTTFWSMIVKATNFSHTQHTLNAAIPKEIAIRMKGNENICDVYENATVVFLDIVGYTKFCDGMNPKRIVEYLNLIYKKIDDIVYDYDLEKIKVIGDCYMVVGGIHDKSGHSINKDRHASFRYDSDLILKTINFSKKVLDMCSDINKNLDSIDLHNDIKNKLKWQKLQMRIGLSNGILTAGVFGQEKIQYDVFGDTVNLASRLESTGVPEKIQICEKTYNLIKDSSLNIEKRENKVYLKGLGDCDTYLI